MFFGRNFIIIHCKCEGNRPKTHGDTRIPHYLCLSATKWKNVFLKFCWKKYLSTSGRQHTYCCRKTPSKALSTKRSYFEFFHVAYGATSKLFLSFRQKIHQNKSSSNKKYKSQHVIFQNFSQTLNLFMLWRHCSIMAKS